MKTDGRLSDLVARVETVGAELQAAITESVRDLGGVDTRPAHLARRLGMDTTAVWRVLRAATAPSPIACVHVIPGPMGLADFRRAVVEHGGGHGERLGGAITGFEALLADFPSGRRGLNSAIEGWLPEARERGLRTAAQGAVRAFSQLIGCQVRCFAVASVLVPSEDEGYLDLVHVRVLHQVRRMRDGAAISLTGTHILSLRPEAEPMDLTRSLGTHERREDIRGFLLPAFGTRPAPELGAVRLGQTSTLTLPVGLPDVSQPVTIALGYRTRLAWRAARGGGIDTEWISNRCSLPTRTMVSDLIVPRSMWSGGLPEILITLQSGTPVNPDSDRAAYELTELPLGISCGPATLLSPDLAELGTGEAPTYLDAVRFAFQAEGIDPRSYVAFRASVDHPVPLSTQTWFYPLPASDAPTEQEMPGASRRA